MAEIFLFNIPAPSASEEAAFSINLYESVDGLSSWSLADTILVSALLTDPSGKSRWESALSDAAKYHMLVAVSEGGQESVVKTILPPRGPGANCTIFLNVKDILSDAAHGITVKAKLSGSRVAIGGSLTSLEEHEFTTDTGGYVAFSVLQGIKVLITCELLGKRAVEVDTTDKVTINLAELS